MRFFQGRVKPVAPAATSVVTAPTNSSLPVITGSLISGQTLSVSTGIWTNSPTSYAYQWLRSGVTVVGSTSTTYVLSSADIGVMISCTVTAINASGSASSSAAAVGPVFAVPVNSSLPAITGTFTKGQLVTVSSGAWLNSPTGFAYQWLRAGVAIVGATATGYTLVAADVGTLISCTVTATNGAGSASASAATVGPIIDLAPVNTVLPALTGTSTVGQVLTVTTGTWSNSPLTYAYAWQLNGSPISGAASVNTYTLTSGENGGNVTCTVTATNSGGSASAISNALGPVGAAGTAPTNTVLPTLSGDPVVGQTLFTTNGTWTGTVTSYTYQWFKDGTAVAFATNDNYLILDADAGSVFLCKVTAFNVGSASTPAASAATSAVVNISLTNAITAFTRTSTSGTVPMTWSVTFGSNVYEGYILHAKVFSDSALTTLVQDVSHLLTNADLQSGATIDLTSDGLTSIGATQWLQLAVETISPNSIAYQFVYPTALSPTDAAIAMTWSPTDIVNATLSANHLTATANAANAGVRASRGIGAGKKVYWELTGVTTYIVAAVDASAPLGTAWGSATDSLTPTTDAGSWYINDGGILAYSSTIRNTIGTWVNTDVLGFTLDTTGASPILGAVKNGTPLGTITMASITLPIFPAAQGNGSNPAVTLNPGITPGGTDGVAHPQAGFVNP